MIELSIQQAIIKNVEKAMAFIIDEARKELRAQGHFFTGKLERSFEAQVQLLSDDCLSGKILHEDYGDSLHTGIPASSVPYREGSGAGSSKYISALESFFRRKGKSAKEARSFAFATAQKAKRIGHPTKPYYAGKTYSKNGRRTGWKDIAYSDENIKKMEAILKLSEFLEQIVASIITKQAA